MSALQMKALQLQDAMKEIGPGNGPTATVRNFTNWDGAVTRQEVIVVKPQTLSEIQQVMKAANQISKGPFIYLFIYSFIYLHQTVPFNNIPSRLKKSEYLTSTEKKYV